MCRACQAAANAAYRAAHHEEAIQASRDYYAAHREQLITYNHAYYQAKRAQILEQKRAYYAERRETIKAQRRRYWPHRPVSSIEKERARHREKGHIYKANERAASLKRKLMTWRQMIGREAP